MEAGQFDRKTFYKLVRKQRKTHQMKPCVEFQNPEISEIEGWADYFEALATPVDSPMYDEDMKQSVETQARLIEELSMSEKTEAPTTVMAVTKHVKHLKNGKAPDIYGVAGEHLKYGPPCLLEVVAQVTNNTLLNGKLPHLFKIGAITPVPKPGKVATNPDNHRRITVCSIIGKVVEKELDDRAKIILRPKQSKQQFGFTEECSPSNCALIITESIAEAQDKDETLYIVYMDVKKAFDTVCHDHMLVSLYNQGIKGTLWSIYRDMYSDIQSQVRIGGKLSRKIKEGQGIRQGANTSTEAYKGKSNPLLHRAASNPVAYRVGTIETGAPTTADDTAYMTKMLHGTQVLVGMAETDSRHARYNFSSTKTKFMTVNQKKNRYIPEPKLYGNDIATTTQERHLGIERTPDNRATATISSRIQSSTRAAYSLMGAGLHGLNGVGPKVSLQMISIYIVPILTYGLEALILKDQDYEALEKHYRSLLRNIQHLPENTAIPAVYMLLGCTPIRGQIHIKILTFFVSILRRPSGVDKDLVIRQLAMKNMKSNSWCTQVRKLLDQYDLPSAYELASNTPAKDVWKKLVKKKVNEFWHEQLMEEAQQMKTLKYLNIRDCYPGYIHSTWNHNTDPLEAHMATIKARVLVQRYPLSSSKYAGKKKSPACPLCMDGEETTEHFLVTCTALMKRRVRYLEKLHNLLVETGNPLPRDVQELVKLVLTPDECVSKSAVE